jgi:hypothetical protein
VKPDQPDIQGCRDRQVKAGRPGSLDRQDIQDILVIQAKPDRPDIQGLLAKQAKPVKLVKPDRPDKQG